MKYQIWNLGSSSEGNCFIVKHRDCKTGLMLECGLPYNRFKKQWANALTAPFPTTILISHEHQDHSRDWKRFSDYGCNICASFGTAEALGDKTDLIRCVIPQEWQITDPIGDHYEVFPLVANHDAAEPLMYLIRAKGFDEILLFAIDTADIPYDFKNFNITDMLVECNYSESDISPDMDPVRMERVRNTHMSLEMLTKFFERQKFPNLQQITLCHLSQSNCDPKKAKETIMAATGVPVRVCAAKGGFID